MQLIFILFFPAKNMNIEKVTITEPVFRWELNDDKMACDKLSEGIRKFAEDAIKLENMVKSKM